ncbi:MAG: hypothetical protein EXR62_09605 [Chloroflexi bacterium]|nr:hypothetical protein [Chloroflexota bacterium]
MSNRTVQRGQRMVAYAEEMINQMLTWEGEHPEADLDDMESDLLCMRHQMSEKWLQEIVQQRAESSRGGDVRCERYGQVMRLKGNKAKRWQTLVGELTVERRYYYCRAVRLGFSPLDRQMRLPSGSRPSLEHPHPRKRAPPGGRREGKISS